jgi:hypothetical protein
MRPAWSSGRGNRLQRRATFPGEGAGRLRSVPTICGVAVAAGLYFVDADAQARNGCTLGGPGGHELFSRSGDRKHEQP